MISEEYIKHVQMLKRGDKGDLKMIYSGHTIEVPLSNRQLQLYRTRKLTLDLDQGIRQRGFAGADRRAQEGLYFVHVEQGGSSRETIDEKEDNASSDPMYTSGSMPPRSARPQ